MRDKDMSKEDMSDKQKDEEMICALSADERGRLQAGLNALPDTMPPRDVWLRIRRQAEAEGLLGEPSRGRGWYLGVGAAAAVLLAVMLLPRIDSVDEQGTTVPAVASESVMPGANLKALRAESRQLEQDLRLLPGQPRVSQAGTVATISEIEERIAAIDYQLNDTSVTMSLDDREIYWSERVRLMKVLLQLRYAQAQRAAY